MGTTDKTPARKNGVHQDMNAQLVEMLSQATPEIRSQLEDMMRDLAGAGIAKVGLEKFKATKLELLEHELFVSTYSRVLSVMIPLSGGNTAQEILQAMKDARINAQTFGEAAVQKYRESRARNFESAPETPKAP